MIQRVESKICELCSRPFMRAVAPCRALAENDCPKCRETVAAARREHDLKRRNAMLMARARSVVWTVGLSF